MSAQFYVKQAEVQVAEVRRRLTSVGLFQDLDVRLNVDEFASLAGDCEIVMVSELTERRGLELLERLHKLEYSDREPTDIPLAGFLCVANRASRRWILVRSEDPPRRQRFTIAHELGHLFLEVEPEFSQSESEGGELGLWFSDGRQVHVVSRCSSTKGLLPPGPGTIKAAPVGPDLREIKAHHFASELLMPHEGVKRLVRQLVGAGGIRTAGKLDELVRAISQQYDVSIAAARLRAEKDLAIIPIDNHPNGDLFG